MSSLPPINRDVEQRAYWHATMPPLPDRGGRHLPDVVDLAVVGGGYTGLAAARKAALGGARVVVLEAETLGWGASSRNGGIAHPGYKWGPRTMERRWGREVAAQLYRDTLEATDMVAGLIRDNGVDAELRWSGYAELAWAPSHYEEFADEVEALAEHGIRARRVPREALAAEVGTSAFHGGIVIDGGGVLHPAKWLVGLVGLAERAGAELHERARVRSVRRQADGRFVVETARGALLARDVLVATNAYTDGVAPAVRRRVLPIGSYMIATEPLSEDLAREISPTGRAYFDTRNFLSYWHVSADRRVLFGGRVSFIPTTVGRTAGLLYRRMLEIHPQLAGTRVEYSWGGKVAITMDRMPHIGRGPDGVMYAVGYSGTGLLMSTWLGTRAADWMGGGEAPALSRLRFPLVPAPYEGRPWFLPVVGEWFRLQDRLAVRGTAQGGAPGAEPPEGGA